MPSFPNRVFVSRTRHYDSKLFFAFSVNLVSILLIQSLLVSHVTSLNCPGDNEPPKIAPSGPPPSYHNTKNYLNTYGFAIGGTKGFNAQELSLDCKAPYPVEWTFQGNQVTWVKIKTKVVTKTIESNGSPCYTASLNPVNPIAQFVSIFAQRTDLVLAGRTGNYSCRSVSDINKASSVFKFVFDEKDGFLFNSKPRVNATIVRSEENSDEVVIPCPANIEGVQASLHRIDENGTTQHSYNDGGGLRYDPKIGFLLKYDQFVTAIYKCHGEYKTKTEDVIVDYRSVGLFEPNPSSPSVTFDALDQFTLRCDADEPVTFDYSHAPSVTIGNDVTLTSKSYKHAAKVIVTKSSQAKDLTGQISCVTVNGNKVLFTWKYNVSNDCSCMWEPAEAENVRLENLSRYFREDVKYLYPLSVARIGRFLCNNSNGLDTDAIFLPCANPSECDIMRNGINEDNFNTLERGFPEEASQATVISSQVSSGWIKCSVEGYSKIRQVNGGIKSIFFNDIPASEQISIAGAEQNIFLGDTMLFTCNAASYLFAQELKWAFGFKNGTVAFIDIKTKNDSMNSLKSRIYRVSYIQITNPDTTHLYCFAPMWNSTEWRNASMPILLEDFTPYGNISLTPSATTTTTKADIIMKRFSDPTSKKVRIAHRVTDATVVIRDPVQSIQLECLSKFPVQWIYEGSVINSTSKFSHQITQSSNSNNPSLSFQSTIEVITNFTGTTGNYTCRKMNSDQALASVFIFSSWDGLTPILNHGQHLNVKVNSGDDWITLPCRVSEPSVIVHLYEQDDSGEFHQLYESSTVLFDAKKGFLIGTSRVRSLPQFYACATAANDTGHGLSFSIVPGREMQAVAASSMASESSNTGLYVFLALLVIAVVALSGGVVFLWKELKRQKQLMHNMTGARMTLSPDRQPVVFMDELAGRSNDTFQGTENPSYEAL